MTNTLTGHDIEQEELAEEWELSPLGDQATVVMGQAPPGSECNRENMGTPFVKVGEFGAEFPSVREWTTKPLRMAAPNDVLICVVGATAGKINRSLECAIGRSVFSLLLATPPGPSHSRHQPIFI